MSVFREVCRWVSVAPSPPFPSPPPHTHVYLPTRLPPSSWLSEWEIKFFWWETFYSSPSLLPSTLSFICFLWTINLCAVEEMNSCAVECSHNRWSSPKAHSAPWKTEGRGYDHFTGFVSAGLRPDFCHWRVWKVRKVNWLESFRQCLRSGIRSGFLLKLMEPLGVLLFFHVQAMGSVVQPYFCCSANKLKESTSNQQLFPFNFYPESADPSTDCIVRTEAAIS